MKWNSYTQNDCVIGTIHTSNVCPTLRVCVWKTTHVYVGVMFETKSKIFDFCSHGPSKSICILGWSEKHYNLKYISAKCQLLKAVSSGGVLNFFFGKSYNVTARRIV